MHHNQVLTYPVSLQLECCLHCLQLLYVTVHVIKQSYGIIVYSYNNQPWTYSVFLSILVLSFLVLSLFSPLRSFSPLIVQIATECQCFWSHT